MKLIKDFKDLGMGINSFLPDHYTPIEQPFFQGKGNHSITQLEDLCERFQEYCHQQAIIKQELIKTIKQ